MPDDNPDQLKLPLEGTPAVPPDAAIESHGQLDHSTKIIQFADALKAHKDTERRDAIRRILTLREDIQEG